MVSRQKVSFRSVYMWKINCRVWDLDISSCLINNRHMKYDVWMWNIFLIILIDHLHISDFDAKIIGFT